MACAKIPDHMFVSSFGGDLFDTRVPGWHTRKALRPGYYGLLGPEGPNLPRGVMGAQRIKAALRHGPNFNYVAFFITSDGAVLSFESVRENLSQILYSTIHGLRDGWQIVGIDHSGNCDSEEPETCAHSGKPIWESDI